MKRFTVILSVLAVGLGLVGSMAPAIAQSGNTWQADYFNNPDWAGAPVTTEFVSLASFDWGYGSPSPYVPADNFTARFTTDAFFYAGNYTFSVIADDEFILVVDGVTIPRRRGHGQSGKPANIMLPMSAGPAPCGGALSQVVGHGLSLPTGRMPAAGPATSAADLYPPLPADSVLDKFGDYTACLQRRHQANCFVSRRCVGLAQPGIDPDGAADRGVAGELQAGRQISTFYISPEVPAKEVQCSKTRAGWFPN